MCIRYRTGACVTLRLPLIRTGRALRQLPVIAKQVFKEVVTPLRRRTGPDDFQAAGERIRALAGAKAVLPTEALLLNRSTLRLRSHLGAWARAVRLAKGVAARNQGNGFFVIHRHATRKSHEYP